MRARSGAFLLCSYLLACSKPSPPPPAPAPAASAQVTSVDAAASVAAQARRVVTTGLTSPKAMVATGGHLYVADDVHLLRVPTSGGELETVATADGPIRGLAVSDQDVLWLTPRGVYRIRSVNTKTFTVHTLRTGDTYHAVAVSEGDVIIAEGNEKRWAIRRVKDATTAIIADLTTKPVSIAADKTHVWIADAGGRVLRAARFPPADVKTIIPPPSSVEIWRLAASADDVFALGGDKLIDGSVPPPGQDGGPYDPRLLRLEKQDRPAKVLWRGVATDWLAQKDRVVLLDAEDGTIAVVPAKGDAKERLLPIGPHARARAIAIEPGWIYVANAAEGGVKGEIIAIPD
jgi:hypothetical protein